MDADEQRPTPEQTAAAGTSEATTAARDQREAACRAAHPSGRLAGAGTSGTQAQNAAAHYERAAVSWLAGQRERLVVWPQDDATRALVLDALGDVAQLVALRLRRDSQPLGADYALLLDTLAAVAARADTRDVLRQDPRALLPLVAVQAALRAGWQTDASLAQTLDTVLAERSVPGLARTPQDQIALHFQLSRAGIDLPCPHLPSLLATSVLADDVVALRLTRADVHSLTTILASASDFGATEIAWPAGATAEGVIGALEEWLVLAMADEDSSLVSELLGGLSCIGAPSSEVADTARRWLRGWQESDGRVEGTLATPSEPAAVGAGSSAWAAAVHTTAMTALESLLLRTRTAVPSGSAVTVVPALPVVSRTDLIETIMAAADWLDVVLPGTHVQGRLWTSEAWAALGDEDEARRQLLRLAEDPHIAFTVLKQSGEQAVHLAALVVALGVTSPPLADLCDDVAALLTHPEAAQALLGQAKARASAAQAEADPEPTHSGADAELRQRTAELCARLLGHGSRPHGRSQDDLGELLLLAQGTRAAARTGDLEWLSLTLRGLHRLGLVPRRLVQDALVVLRREQRPDGAIGRRPSVELRGDRQVLWTLAALPALVEGLPTQQLPDAA